MPAATCKIDPETLRIGCAGVAALHRPHAHVEPHVEQAPVLDAEGVTIGESTRFPARNVQAGTKRNRPAGPANA